MNDTIAAISTPLGEGAIALLRVSGPGAVALADAVFRGKKSAGAMAARVQQFGAIFDAEQKLDDVLLTVFRAPHSYTGEDTVEIACHGGVMVTRRDGDIDPEAAYTTLVSYRTGDVWVPKLDNTEALRHVSQEFIDAIEEKRAPLTDGHAGLRVVRLLEAAQQSIKTGRTVTL